MGLYPDSRHVGIQRTVHKATHQSIDTQATNLVTMNPITLEYLRITVDTGFNLLAPAFAALRKTVAETGGVKEQYFGMADNGKNELLWILSMLQIHGRSLACSVMESNG